jgi:serine/threonine-protein kinase
VTDDRARWARVEAIFREAMDLEPRARRRFVEDRCEGDPGLHAEVRSLLDASDAAEEFLQEPAAAYAAGIAADPTTDPTRTKNDAGASRRIGAYEITREIGRGGMGTVFLAARVDGQFEHHVALKLLKRGMDSDEIQRRFLQERQILAWLKHPNIAALLDGGITDEGAPYFVMEYVEGSPLTQYGDDHRLSLRERLRLFRDVCQGVQHAHLNLVVHRDLKPANVLVTADGRVKLLDFGVAKLIEPSGDAATTRFESRVLTPQYSAPEQILGNPITVASDVYALGVILYELLTGSLPYVVPPGIGGERVVLESDPKLPSVVAAQGSGDAGPGRPDPKALRGDLDNIVLKALRKDPVDRYTTADALSRDIEAYLDDRPVAARPHSASYRVRKFVKRHRLAVGAAAFILVTVFAGVAGVIWQARETAREARKADASKEFLASLFEIADPSESGGQTITTRQLLDRGAARIGTELADEPDVKAEIETTIGWMYHKLGAYDEAQRLLEGAVAYYRHERDPQLPRVLAALATVHQARGAFEDAERFFRESVERTEEQVGAQHLDLAYRLNDLAVLLKDKGDRAEAERLQRRVLEMKRRLVGNDLATASTLNNLAVLLADRGELTEAEGLYREALEIRRTKLGADHLLVINTLNNLLVLLRQREDLDAAEPLAREVLAVRRRVQGEDHPDVSVAMYNLAAILRTRGSHDEAEPLFREAIDRTIAVKGREHPEVASMRSGLASLLRSKDAPVDAERLARVALADLDPRLPDDHPVRAMVLLELGQDLLGQGRNEEAEPMLRRARGVLAAKFGEGSLQAADASLALGTCLARAQRLAEARVEIGRARETFVAKLGEGSDRAQRAARVIADLAVQ